MLQLAIFSPEERNAIEELFAGASQRAKVVVFARGTIPSQFDDALRELQALAPWLSVERRTYAEDDVLVQVLGIDKAPALAILAADGTDTGIRFYGYPIGYEFGTFIQDLADVAKGVVELSTESLQRVQSVHTPAHIKVFVTPT